MLSFVCNGRGRANYTEQKRNHKGIFFLLEMELEATATARKEEQFLNSLYCVTQRACQTLKKDKDLFSCSYYNRQEIENAVSIAKAIAERIITERGGAVAD